MTIEGSVEESKTICFNFTKHGQLRDGETIASPEVYASDPVVVFGTPVVLTAEFTDSNGKKVASGKGVRVRISSPTATPGTIYDIICRVTTSGGDVIEEQHKYYVKSSLP